MSLCRDCFHGLAYLCQLGNKCEAQCRKLGIADQLREKSGDQFNSAIRVNPISHADDLRMAFGDYLLFHVNHKCPNARDIFPLERQQELGYAAAKHG